ncbi:MAG TPA: Mrp/NBP35 family ATP-binding protein [Acidimicrobiales bacterium]|nr:Mrp/NBP35 family ATP-binding protein [Acidimicrobiales bacterium]
MAVTEAQILDAVGGVTDPELHQSVADLGMVRRVSVDGSRVAVTLAVIVDDYAQPDELIARTGEAVGAVEGVRDVAVDLVAMSDDERADLRLRLHGDPAATAGSGPAHGHAQGRAVPFQDPGNRTRVLLVASGKGGVGKSSVTVNLAVALSQRGKRVAVVDADVWGFSIPPMLGVDRPPTLVDNTMIIPPTANGITVASIGFFVRDDQPVVWRGPMLHKALEQFLTDFYWGAPDFLVVDMPPGTGDISLSIAQFLPRSEAYIVTTPQSAAQRVAQRAGLMFQSDQLKIPVQGVIENMSWFTGDDGTRYELFGAGGGQVLADRLGVPLLGQVPLVRELREGGDVGRPITVADPDGEVAMAFAAIAKQIDEDLAPTKRRHPELKVI